MRRTKACLIVVTLAVMLLTSCGIFASQTEATEVVVCADDEYNMTRIKVNDTSELKLEKIDKISCYFQNDEIFCTDEKTVSRFIAVVKSATVNNDTGLSEELWSLMDSTFTMVIYKGNKPMYKFTLSNGQGDSKVMRVEKEGYYFYCDLTEADQTIFTEIYQEICKSHNPI